MDSTSVNSSSKRRMESMPAMPTTTKTTQMPCPPEDEFNLDRLQERTQWLISNHTKLGKVCVAIAGGGGHAISTLAATSGASQLLLEGTVTYDRASFQNYVKRALPNDKSFSYSSLDAATMASESALLQGMQLRSRNVEGAGALLALRDTIGLGSASTLKTTTQGGMSKSGRPSHGNIVATCSDGRQVGMHLTLNCPLQNRFQQDVFVSHMLLQTLEEVAKLSDDDNTHDGVKTNGETTSNPVFEPDDYDGVTIEQWTNLTTIFGPDQEKQDPVQLAAHRILSGEDKAVLLLPKESEKQLSSSSSSGGCDFLEPLRYPVLPDNCLIMPGSYNPPHHGHVALAQAAIAKVSPDQSQLRPLVFEISIKNADKPSMEPEEVSRRVAQFRTVLHNNATATAAIPQWGILLTSAPLFADKVQALKQYAPPDVQTHPKFPPTEQRNRWSFVIGTDTMVRVLNPKYYNNDYDQMLAAQRSMGADFVVGGRVEQQAGSSNNKFVTGKESLEDLPQDVQDMFVLLDESDFRVDISSTELRSQQQQQQKAAEEPKT